ncbi:mannitol dehydrogenase family protein [Micromonospora sp. NPDC005215]|uniref:mannitol dehydrogenase family protein n=1 Tax=Micromonospora sp. NPDC005215 TaxID=3157024 RepID=UPI00339FE3D6
MAVKASPTLLSRTTLSVLPPAARPLITPGDNAMGLLHIGVGAFHRAHQAVFTEEAMAAAGGDWGIVAVAPRSADLVAQLRAQDHLYSVTSRSGDSSRTRVVGALTGTRHLPTEADDVLRLFADPAIKVVTLTVTEKAYRLDPTTGTLRMDEEIRADLAAQRAPVTIPGLLVRGLRARAAAGSPPVAIVCCDNLPGNGARVRGLVEFATDGGFGDWASYPSTMVDRIVPASTPSTLQRAATTLGVRDLAAVDTETYRQWVLTDDFPGGRPTWEAAGAILTTDVTPWEQLKLRILNGVHSTAAYLGALAGCDTIAETLALPGMANLLQRLITEDITPTLNPPAGVQVSTYGATVLSRFANPAIEHRTMQVAMDGSQKLPQRLVGTVRDRRRRGDLPAYAALAIAAWMRFTMGVADDGQPLPLQDPLADVIRAALPHSIDPSRPQAGSTGAAVRALLRLDAIFPTELAEDAELVAAITGWLDELSTNGAAATVKACTW